MENENTNQYEALDVDGVYRVDFFGQNIEDNKKFKNWQRTQLEIYGKDAKLVKCCKDNIYFYTSNDDRLKENFYSYQCPYCKLYICYFCSKETKAILQQGGCCYTRNIYISFGIDYIEDDLFEFSIIIYHIIPLLNMAAIILSIISLILYKNEYIKEDGWATLYIDVVDSRNFISPVALIIMHAIIAIILSIPYTIYNIYYIIIIWCISIPFKFKPIKCAANFTRINLHDIIY